MFNNLENAIKNREDKYVPETFEDRVILEEIESDEDAEIAAKLDMQNEGINLNPKQEIQETESLKNLLDGAGLSLNKQEVEIPTDGHRRATPEELKILEDMEKFEKQSQKG